ncbi:MAG: aromatic ring-hydroxylating dioxygenase subunit alpha [Proteobacteria bacterium]|nr:aromatic ring-hydroxylating dioxygenase subunit alpha [Pseudomonadota bacterium]
MVNRASVEPIKAGMRYEFERTEPPPGFPKLPRIPGGRYTDPGFLALEHRYLWQRSWLYACHLDELPQPGSFLLFKRTGSPILIVRGKDDVVRAFYNTCRHRGGPVVKEPAGRAEGLVCQYHGWTYGLDGRLLNLRDKRDFPDFDPRCYGLNAVRCERLGNWVFVNEDPDATPLLASLGEIPALWADIQPEQQRFVHKKSYRVKCNVKVLLDAFLEVYHLKSIHQNTVDRFLDYRGTTITLWPHGHSLMVTPNRRPDWVDPGTKGLLRLASASEITANHNPSYHVFPNLVTPIADSGIPFILFWPAGAREMEIEVVWFAPDWGGGEPPPQWQTRLANFERILYEDTQFAEYIQESVESPGFNGVNLNYQERRIYHWHEELDRRIGAERVAEHLRVQPVLAPFVVETIAS